MKLQSLPAKQHDRTRSIGKFLLNLIGNDHNARDIQADSINDIIPLQKQRSQFSADILASDWKVNFHQQTASTTASLFFRRKYKYFRRSRFRQLFSDVTQRELSEYDNQTKTTQSSAFSICDRFSSQRDWSNRSPINLLFVTRCYSAFQTMTSPHQLFRKMSPRILKQ